MSRKTKVVGFSLPPEINQKLESVLKLKHKTRSEFMREIIDVYFSSVNNLPTESTKDVNLDEADFAKILKSYWLLRAQSPLQIITVGLAIIEDTNGRVLIGSRKEKDKWVKNLSWVFPGGALRSLDFDKEVQSKVKEETGLEVEVNSLVTARVHPDAGFKSVQIVALYFACSVVNDSKIKANGDLAKLKWVLPLDVFKYFTTSTSDEVTKFLTAIQKSS